MNPTHHGADGVTPHHEHHEHLSAFIDGEVEDAGTDRCCTHWREQAEARQRWHEWHLIGDVLRSEELACGATRSAKFLAQVRSRLADEPVVLAPVRDAATGAAPMDAARQRRRSWLMPAAVAAGFMAVAAVLIVTRMPSPQEATLASRTSPAVVAKAPAVPGATPHSDAPQFVVADGQLVRDARLDRYLAAHKQFGGSSALGVPAGFLRSATLQIPER